MNKTMRAEVEIIIEGCLQQIKRNTLFLINLNFTVKSLHFSLYKHIWINKFVNLFQN